MKHTIRNVYVSPNGHTIEKTAFFFFFFSVVHSRLVLLPDAEKYVKIILHPNKTKPHWSSGKKYIYVSFIGKETQRSPYMEVYNIEVQKREKGGKKR